MTELSKLIIRLKAGINKNATYVQTIRHPKLLVSSLEELNGVIGNEKIKESVANQLSHLIMMKRRSMENNNIKEDNVMLNTVLYGPPGVGKTMIATNLAKIWYSLGYIDGSQNPKNKKELGSMIKDIIKDTGTINTDDDTILSLYLMFIVIMIMVSVLSMTWSFYNKFGGQLTIVALVVILIIFISTCFFIYNIMNNNNNVNKNNDNKINNDNIAAGCSDYSRVFNNDKIPSDDQIIKCVSRQDFVGKYVGWSDKKTIQLLQENLGKVLFIDEAYALINDTTDTFGMEALTALNLFLSQNAGKIIVIMAGYKDLMENGIFAVQPGLKRRFMWQFNADGYNAQELFQIFKIKITNKGWTLTTEDNVEQLFQQNKDIFINQGGDVERLVFFSELEHSKDFINEENGVYLNKLNFEHVKRGLNKLDENNIKTDDNEISDNPLANMMKSFRGSKGKYKPHNPNKPKTDLDKSEFDKSELFSNDKINDPKIIISDTKYDDNHIYDIPEDYESENVDNNISEILMDYIKTNQKTKAYH